MIRFFLCFLIFAFSFPGMIDKSSYAQEIEGNEDGKILISEDNSDQDTELKNGGRSSQGEVDSPLRGWLNGNYATGDWKGYRSKLEEHGITFEVNYTNDSFLKLHGGSNSKVRLRPISLVDFGVTIDMEKFKVPGGKIYILGQNVHGQGLTNNFIGDLQTLSNIDSPPLTQLAEYWYEQKLLKDKFRVKVGKQDANSEFDALTTSEDFVNSSFTLMPVIPMPTYPNQAFGVMTAIEPVNWFNLKAGFYDGDANNRGLGIDSFFNNNNRGFVTIAEAGLTPVIKNRPGNYILGYWHHSGEFPALAEAGRIFTSNNGLYTTFEQMLYKENKDNEDLQGLSVQGQFGWAPSKQSEIARYYGASMTYKGLFPRRNDDITGFGMAMAGLSRQIKESDNLNNETVLELFYKAQLTPFFAIQPDMQFIFNPGGNNPNAFVMGIRTIINF